MSKLRLSLLVAGNLLFVALVLVVWVWRTENTDRLSFLRGENQRLGALPCNCKDGNQGGSCSEKTLAAAISSNSNVVDIETEAFSCRNHTTSPRFFDPVDIQGYSCLLRNAIYHDGTWYLNSSRHIPERLRTFARPGKETDRSIGKHLEYYTGEPPVNVTKALNGTGGLHIILSRFWHNKYGHLIVDAAFPAFYLMHIHNRVTSDNTIVIMDDQNKQPYDDLLHTISTNDIVYNVDHICPRNETCLFPEVLVGISGLGWWFDERQMPERLTISNKLPSFAFSALTKRFDKWDVYAKNKTDKMNVVFIQRGNNRLVSNLPKISHQLSTLFGSIATVMLMKMELLTVYDQVSLFKSASIVIGVDGTAFENVFWMRNGTCVILLSRSPAHAPGEKFNHHWTRFDKTHYEDVAPYTNLWKARGIGVKEVYTHTQERVSESMKSWPTDKPLEVTWNEIEYAFQGCLEHIKGYHWHKKNAPRYYS